MTSATSQPLSWTDFFAVAVRPRTYGSLIYLWLGFPLGLAYFVGLVVGFSTGIPLTILWVGLAILLGTLLAAWGAAGFERQLAIRLLGANVPARTLQPKSERLLSRLSALLVSPALWKGLAFLFVKFPGALATWIVSLVSLIVPLALAILPAAWLVAPGEIHADFGFWRPESFVETLPLSLVGIVGFLLALHLQNGMGWLWARLAEWLLGATVPAPLEPGDGERADSRPAAPPPIATVLG